MADNIANIPSSVSDSTPQATLGSAYVAASGALVFSGASKPSYWPTAPYRVTVFDATNGDITFRVSVDSLWPNVTASVVEGSDHNIASGASAEHLGPLTAGGFDDRADVRIAVHAAATDPHGDRAFATSAVATHEADTTSVHGITDTTKVAIINAANTFTVAQLFAAGTAALPGVAVGTTAYGMYQSGTLTGLSSAGASRFTVDSTKLAGSVPYRASNGSIAAPSLSFTNSTDSGLLRSVGGFNAAAGGATVMQFLSTNIRALVPFFANAGFGAETPLVVSTSVTYDPSIDPWIVYVDSSGGAITITLDVSSLIGEQPLLVFDATGNAAANNITLTDSTNTWTINTNKGGITLIGSGTAVEYRRLGSG